LDSERFVTWVCPDFVKVLAGGLTLGPRQSPISMMTPAGPSIGKSCSVGFMKPYPQTLGDAAIDRML
jgi:hypothetical protein